MLLEARKSKRRKHNKKSTRKRRTASSSASCTRKWCDFGHGIRGFGSRVKQRRIGSIEAIAPGAPQVVSPNHWKPSGDDGRHPGCTGRSTATGISARFDHEVFGQDYNEEILRSIHQCRDKSIGRGNGLIDGRPCGARGRHHGPEVPSPRVRCHRRWIVEQSKALGTDPFGRSYVSNPGTARRYESPSASRSAMDREAIQLDLERTRSVSHPSGSEGLRQERYPVEVTRREPVRQRKQKGKQSLGEQRTGSGEHRVAGREKTQTSASVGPALSQERGKP